MRSLSHQFHEGAQEINDTSCFTRPPFQSPLHPAAVEAAIAVALLHSLSNRSYPARRHNYWSMFPPPLVRLQVAATARTPARTPAKGKARETKNIGKFKLNFGKNKEKEI